MAAAIRTSHLVIPRTGTAPGEWPAGALTYDLVLDHDLAPDYYVHVRGAGESALPQEVAARVVADPFGTGDLGVTGHPRTIRLERFAGSTAWIGSATVVECTEGQDTAGFRLRGVLNIPLGVGVASATKDLPADWGSLSQVVPFGALDGGGFTIDEAPLDSGWYSFWNRVFPTGTRTVNVQRNSAATAIAHPVTVCTYVVEWGSEWTVTHVQAETGITGVLAWSSRAIGHTVTRASTWIWGSYYRGEGQNVDGHGQTQLLITLGDGATENPTETVFSLANQYTVGTSTGSFYVLEHPDLRASWSNKASRTGFRRDSGQPLLTIDAPVVEDDMGGEGLWPSGLVVGDLQNEQTEGAFICNGLHADTRGSRSTLGHLYWPTQDEDALADTERNTGPGRFLALAFGRAGWDIKDQAGTIIGETASVFPVDGTWQSVGLRNTYTNPVAFYVPGNWYANRVQTLNAGEGPQIARVRNVGATSLEVQLQLISKQPVHTLRTPERVTLVVLEAGAHVLPGPVNLEVGKVTIVTGGYGGNPSNGRQLVTPTLAFTNAVFICAAQDFAEVEPNYGASQGYGASLLYANRSFGNYPALPTFFPPAPGVVGWLVIETALGQQTNGMGYAAGYTADTVDGLYDGGPNEGFSALPGTDHGVIYGHRYGQVFGTGTGTGTGGFPEAIPIAVWEGEDLLGVHQSGTQTKTHVGALVDFGGITGVQVIEVVGAGGALASGDAIQEAVLELLGDGGAQAGGEAPTAPVLVLEGRGGALTTGEAAQVLEAVLEGIGAAVASGQAEVELISPVSIEVVGEGGAVAGGRALVQVFIVGQVPAGSSQDASAGAPALEGQLKDILEAAVTRSSITADLQVGTLTARLIGSVQEVDLA